jgi:hypothetical protein
MLLVIGSVLTALAILAGWAQWQLLDTGAWRDTSGRLLERQEIRDRLAEYVVAEVRKASGGALPPAAGDRLERTVARQLGSRRVERAWRASTTEAHRELVRLIEDDSASRGDVVTLDLRPLIRAVARELGIPLPAVPASVGQVTIVAGNQVRGAREAADQLQRTAAVLLILAPLTLLLAVLAATGWRVRAIAGVGVAVAAAGGLVLLARALVGAHVVEVLTPSGGDDAAAAAAWSVGTSQLAWIAGAAVVVGLLVAVVASLAARTGAGSRPGYV